MIATVGDRSDILNLTDRQANDESVELLRDLDLAGQTAVLLEVHRAVEHDALLLGSRRKFVEPVWVHIPVASGAGTVAAAIADDSVNQVVSRSLHEAVARFALDNVLSAVV